MASAVFGGESPLDQHLQTIDWGRDTYPVDLLELRAAEQRLVDSVAQGLSLADYSRASNTPDKTVEATNLAATGKQQAAAGLDGPITSLSPLAKRVVLLNDLFGEQWNHRSNVVVCSEAEVVLSNTREIDAMIGDSWHRYPQISVIPADTIRERVQRYDAQLGLKWRSSPIILTLSPDKVKAKAAQYNQWFGDEWLVKPSLLTNSPSTVIASARALGSIGINRQNTEPNPYYGSLTTSVASKRAKAAMIRRELLGHTQVRIHTDPATIDEQGRKRRLQTEADKAAEAREVAEFKLLMQRLGAAGLMMSIDEIRKWGHEHGYRGRR